MSKATKCSSNKAVVTKCLCEKCLCDQMSMWEMSMWPNVYVRNVNMKKYPCDKIYMWQSAWTQLITSTFQVLSTIYPNCPPSLSDTVAGFTWTQLTVDSSQFYQNSDTNSLELKTQTPSVPIPTKVSSFHSALELYWSKNVSISCIRSPILLRASSMLLTWETNRQQNSPPNDCLVISEDCGCGCRCCTTVSTLL